MHRFDDLLNSNDYWRRHYQQKSRKSTYNSFRNQNKSRRARLLSEWTNQSKEEKILGNNKHFLEGSEIGNLDSMLEYGKMLFIGEGVKLNLKESLSYIKMVL